MNRQLLSLLGVAVSIVLALGGWLYFSRIDEKRINPAQALPDNMAFAIEVEESSRQLKQLDDPTFMNRLLSNDEVSSFYQELRFVDSLLQADATIASWFNKGKSVYSFHVFENGNTGFLMGVQTLQQIDEGNALQFFQNHFPGRYKMSRRKLINETLYDFTDFETDKSFTIAFKNRLMFFSPNGSLVELALLKLSRLNLENPTEDPLSFVRKNGSSLLLHINYKNLGHLFKTALLPELGIECNLVKQFAERAIYEIKLDDEDLLLTGAVLSHETEFQFLDLLNAQAPISNNLAEYLPTNTNFAITLGFNGYSGWYKNGKEYLLSKKLYQTYKSYIDSQEKVIQYKFAAKMPSYFSNHCALISIDEPGMWKDSCYIMAIELNDAGGMQMLMLEMDQAVKQKLAGDSLQVQKDSLGNVGVCHFGDAMKYYFTDLFEGFWASRYIIKGNYLFLSNNTKILQMLQSKWEGGNTLAKNENYKQFAERLVPQSNLELLLCNEHAPKYALNFVNRELFSKMNKQMGILKRARFAALQVAGSNDKIFASQFYVKFNITKAEKNEQVWAIQLDTGLAIKPAMFMNTTLGSPVIMVQDLKHKLYQVDREGKILWTKALDGPIISEIKEIELYNNGRKQMVFNTSHQIYILDDMGKDLSGWPAWIPTGTQLPISILDPLNNKGYLFLQPDCIIK